LTNDDLTQNSEASQDELKEDFLHGNNFICILFLCDWYFLLGTLCREKEVVKLLEGIFIIKIMKTRNDN